MGQKIHNNIDLKILVPSSLCKMNNLLYQFSVEIFWVYCHYNDVILLTYSIMQEPFNSNPLLLVISKHNI